MTEPPRETTVALPGIRLALCEWGPPDAPPVLCLHGWLDNAASFAPLAPLLPGLRLIAVDLAGHGRSGHRPAGIPYHYLDWIGEVLQLADALQLSRFSLLGHSMGASIAALVAGSVPDRVERLALIEGIGPRSIEDGRVGDILLAYLKAEKKLAARTRPPRPAAFRTAVRARLVASRIEKSSAELLTRRGTLEQDGAYIWRNDRRLSHIQPVQLSEGQIREFLRRIDCPTLAMTARDGVSHHREFAAERRACVRGLQHVEVAGRHHVHMDQPRRVAAQLVPFFSSAS